MKQHFTHEPMIGSNSETRRPYPSPQIEIVLIETANPILAGSEDSGMNVIIDGWSNSGDIGGDAD